MPPGEGDAPKLAPPAAAILPVRAMRGWPAGALVSACHSGCMRHSQPAQRLLAWNRRHLRLLAARWLQLCWQAPALAEPPERRLALGAAALRPGRPCARHPAAQPPRRGLHSLQPVQTSHLRLQACTLVKPAASGAFLRGHRPMQLSISSCLRWELRSELQTRQLNITLALCHTCESRVTHLTSLPQQRLFGGSHLLLQALQARCNPQQAVLHAKMLVSLCTAVV